MEWGTSDTMSALALLVSAASAFYAYRTYRATVELKVHDFRLQLQTANETLRAAVSGLDNALAMANRSRRGVLAANGGLGGGSSRQWDARFAELKSEIEALSNRLPSEGDVQALDLDTLRAQIVETHAFQARATAVKAEIDERMQEDAVSRAEFRADQRVRTAASLGGQGSR